jgi:hypothetical protein
LQAKWGPVRVKKTRQIKSNVQNEMPLESLPAAVREEISIAYELTSPGDSKSSQGARTLRVGTRVPLYNKGMMLPAGFTQMS